MAYIPSVWYEDVNYHTGYYRFSEYFNGNNPVFKVHGIPCLQQRGIKEFVFFTETDMVGMNSVVAVKIQCKECAEKQKQSNCH